jgi:rSAM/selenodomain-associated transferase 2
MTTSSLAIIIPTLNEAANIGSLLKDLRALQLGAPIVVVDGASTDQTISQAQGLADQVITAAPGRASQMNAGAATLVHKPDYLLFLHADTRLPKNAGLELARAFAQGALWGRFDVQISGQSKMLALVARLMNWRSRLTGIATGDQAMFVRTDVFAQLGGFKDQPLMEDIELSRRLRALARPACLRGPAVTSGRRWESRGVWRTIFLMWRLRYRYWRGHSAEALAKEYR